MPKVNVYLPDELAEAVRAAGIPVSTVCQRALEEAVRSVANPSITFTATFERFTNRARHVVEVAHGYAQAENVDLSSEHILQALFVEPEAVAAKTLASLNITEGAVEASVSKRSATADGTAVYAQALQEALKLGHNYIGTEHMLLAMVEGASTARDVLSEFGVTASALRRQVLSVLTSEGVPAPVDLNAALTDVVRRLEEIEKQIGK
jgi:ATP-dependent Clp protease ATP-binding subunit ClpA